MPRTKASPDTTAETVVTTAAAEEPAPAPKRRGRKPGSKNKTAAPKPVKRGRKPAPKKAHTPAPELYMQVAGREYNCIALMEQARADYRAGHKTGIHTCKVYVKPEENMVYYVINKTEGKFPLE